MEKSPSEIKSKIASNRDEESEHIEPWMKFADFIRCITK